jgi:hypothetical protein
VKCYNGIIFVCLRIYIFSLCAFNLYQHRSYTREDGKGKEEREKQKRGKGVLELCCPLPMSVGPDGLVDDEDIPTLPACLPPVPRADVVSQSWHSIPPGWLVWSTKSSDGGHARVGSIV